MAPSILVGLALSTLASEDLALIAGGLLAREGNIPLLHAVIACGVGVYIGDLGLWCAGRLCGPRVLGWPWLRTSLNPAALESLSARVDKRLALAILLSRFVPGTRLPMYVAAGVWGRRPLAFAVWSLLAVMAWTPLLVVSTAYFGEAVVAPLFRGIQAGLFATIVTMAGAWACFKLWERAAGWVARRLQPVR
jgi:membrane protein DedA with SNARE-associated domain